MANPAVAKNFGIFGWNYNRANFKFDQGLRWQRYTTGRKMAMAQAGMFRQDVTDLAGVSMAKLKVYGPIYGIVVTVCVTVFVEGRSGLKFPGPPVFISQIYLQCLAIGMCFMVLATWLLFHSSMRAQIACVQLRTRKVRLPVPTQRQLDSSRKLLSTYEEQGLYDMFRVPFVMPNGAKSPETSDEEDNHKGYHKGGIPGVAAKVKAKLHEAHQSGATTHSARMPGLTQGVPSWYKGELEDREHFPESSPSGYGMDDQSVPLAHFEMLREAQKDWWACEAYMRIAFLYGMMHLIMAFSYWITLHNICELGMIWCSNLGAAGLTAGVWIIFRIDVLPEHGGAFPVEIGGPFVTSIALGLMYAHSYTQTMIDIARVVAAFIILMHVALCFRMYSVAKPSMGRVHHQAKESGGRLFNQSGACDSPAWMPTAFQHVMYLVAPPKTEEQLEQERRDRDNKAISSDPLAKVDMAPWYYLRAMIAMCVLGWVLQIVGHAVECVMGERMLTSNPGQPPWSRTGQWYGWEHGPVSSKHYAHVTPQRGHWAWQRGWGPQGQQELWASDMFGFAPEADAWWSEKEGPEPHQGAPYHGENTWAKGVIAYGQNEPRWGAHHAATHDFESSGGHRRLSGADTPRPAVPLPVKMPTAMEPDFLVCGRASGAARVAALAASGLGALLPAGGAEGHVVGAADAFTLEGLLELGFAHSASWTKDGILVVSSSGRLALCPTKASGEMNTCSELHAPALPVRSDSPAAALEIGSGRLRAFVAAGTRIAALELADGIWTEAGHVMVPEDVEVAVLSASREHLVATSRDGTAYLFNLHIGSAMPTSRVPSYTDVPMAGSRRTWQAACALPDGRVLRLASTWQRERGVAASLKQEFLL